MMDTRNCVALIQSTLEELGCSVIIGDMLQSSEGGPSGRQTLGGIE
jgi:hypothetical protein